MQQIRIASANDKAREQSQRFECEWMEASLMNRWLIKLRLAEAVEAHGADSHWVETRPTERARAAAIEQ
jgi:hypothetical protein